jgi:molecular chaperone DnaK
LPPFLPKGSPVELSYQYNANQVLEVAIEACGKRSNISIERNTGLAQSEMVQAASGLEKLHIE